MTDKKETKSAFSGCCPGAEFKMPAGGFEKMSEMMDPFRKEDGTFDCESMKQKFCGEEADFNREEMFQMMQKMCCAPSDKPEEK